MQYRLRTLLIVLTVGPLALAAIAYAISRWLSERVVTTEWKAPMFRFTIRELVLLTLVVAMGVAW